MEVIDLESRHWTGLSLGVWELLKREPLSRQLIIP
jgi:hypothetical protein